MQCLPFTKNDHAFFVALFLPFHFVLKFKSPDFYALWTFLLHHLRVHINLVIYNSDRFQENVNKLGIFGASALACLFGCVMDLAECTLLLQDGFLRCLRCLCQFSGLNFCYFQRTDYGQSFVSFYKLQVLISLDFQHYIQDIPNVTFLDGHQSSY